MEYSNINTDSAIYKSTARAEDGMQKPTRRDALTEGVLIPLGSIGAIFLAILGIMLLNR